MQLSTEAADLDTVCANRFLSTEKGHLTSTRIPSSIKTATWYSYGSMFAVAYYIQWDQLEQGIQTFGTVFDNWIKFPF